MRPAPGSPRALVGAARRLVQRRALRVVLAAAAGLAPAVLLIAWLAGVRWTRPSPWPLLLELAALASAIGLAAWWRKRLRPRLDERAVAVAAEDRLGMARGALGGVLELQDTLPAGTSPALARRAEASLAPALAGRGATELSGALGERWRRRERLTLAGLVLVAGSVVLVGFAKPERSRAGWAPLLHPVVHLTPVPLPPLGVEPGHADVARGASLTVRVYAPGREAVTLSWRLAGDVLQRRTLPVIGDSARGEIARVDASGRYWVQAPDGAASERYRIAAVDALVVSELAIDVIFPAYLGRPTESYQGEPPPLELPAGTLLQVRGRATRPLRLAGLQGAAGFTPFEVTGDRFAGRWRPTASGVYLWSLSSTRGSPPDVIPAPLEVVIVPDAPPAVEITFPGADTIVPEDLRQLLRADARDDHGLVQATLVSWRVRRTGGDEPAVEVAIPLAGGERALLSPVLDVSERGLLPGDTLKYFIRVRDGSPQAQSAVSATYSLRLPTAEQLRLRALEQARAATAHAQSLSTAAAEIAGRTRTAERRASAANARRGRSESTRPAPGGRESARMEFGETEAARALLRDQEQLLEQVAQLRENMAELEQAAAAAGLQDADMQAKLAELRELMDRLDTPGMRRQLEQLQQALRELDPQQMQQALAQLAEQQQALQQQLEQQLEMLRRAAAQQELGALAQQARELATQQEALAEAHRERRDAQREELAQQQRELAQQGERLADDMEQVREQLERQQESAPAERTQAAAQRARAAESAMEHAASSAEQRRSEDAARQGEQAAAQLSEAAQTLDQAGSEMAAAGRDEARGAMEQATRDALALAQRQLELQQRMEHGEGGEPRAQGTELPKPPQPGNSGAASGEPSGARSQQPSGAQPGGGEEGQRAAGRRQGGQPGGQAGGESGGAQPGGGQRTAGMPGAAELAQLGAEQGALGQGLEQLGRNVRETAAREGMLSRDVEAALGRAGLAMRQTQQGLAEAARTGRLPTEQAAQSVESLNRLALALLNNARRLEGQGQGGGAGQQPREQLADMARAQSSLNGQSASLLPLGLSESATADQARRLGREQQQLADRLGGMNDMRGGREDPLGELDQLAAEAEALARELQGGRIPPEVIARQERLFHRLLDAGRTLEREETGEEREAEPPGRVAPLDAPPLDPALLRDGSRYRVPTPQELRALPPGYRRLILDYFARLNRPLPPAPATAQP